MFFEYIQGQSLQHLPEQSIPALNHSFRKEIFSNILPESSLTQLKAIPSSPVPSYMGEEVNSHLFITSFQILVENNKVSPEAPLFQTWQSQFTQPLLTILVLQISHQLLWPSLDTQAEKKSRRCSSHFNPPQKIRTVSPVYFKIKIISDNFKMQEKWIHTTFVLLFFSFLFSVHSIVLRKFGLKGTEHNYY